MRVPTVDIYTDLHCPWAYLACYRLRQIWPDYAGRVQLVWRALSLEYINQRGTPKPILEVEIPLVQRVAPAIPVQPWSRPAWQWPVTFWPAFEALACAQAQGPDAAFAFSWALRQAFFAAGRSPSLRHELMAIASEVTNEAPLDVARFGVDWDTGRYKAQVITDSRRGWHTLNVQGSPTFVLADGTRFTTRVAATWRSTKSMARSAVTRLHLAIRSTCSATCWSGRCIAPRRGGAGRDRRR